MPHSIPVHDRVFRHAFDTPETAAELAENLLPSRYRRRIAGAAVSVSAESFVESDLRGRFTDLLIEFKRPAERTTSAVSGGGRGRRRSRAGDDDALYLYVLVDHKSQPERWVSFQLLRYIVSVWERLLRDDERLRYLPEIVPVVLYHGSSTWGYPLQFSALVEGASREVKHIPRFEPLFVDVGAMEADGMQGGVRTVVALLVLKYLSRRIDEQAAALLLDAMHREALTPQLQAFYEPLYTALLEAKEQEEIDLLLAQARRRRYSDSEEALMTYGEQLRTEGRQEGREEGREEGRQKGREEGRLRDKREVLVRLLSRRFAVSAADQRLIEATEDAGLLDEALDELVVAESKEVVLAKLRR